MNRLPTVVLGLVVLLSLSGCLSGWVSEPKEPEVVTRTYEPMNITHESIRFGHHQHDDEVVTPTPLENKTTRKDINVSLVERLLLKKLNSYREISDEDQLIPDPRLARIARHHSYDMASKDYINHTDSDGVTFGGRLKRSSYSCASSWENIHVVYWKLNYTETEEELAESTLRSFIRSRDHNLAMIDPNMTTVGIGIYVAKDRRVYVTMNLCDGSFAEGSD